VFPKQVEERTVPQSDIKSIETNFHLVQMSFTFKSHCNIYKSRKNISDTFFLARAESIKQIDV